MQPRLAMTLGDPAGIGPEVVLKALTNVSQTQRAQVTVFGSLAVLEETYQQLRSLGQSVIDPDQLCVYDIPVQGDLQLGVGNAISGAASFAWMEAAIAQTLAGSFQGIVTAPIAKSAWKAAGYEYPGQTELLAQQAGVDQFGMLFVAKSPYTDRVLKVLLATTHIPLKAVPGALNADLMTQKLDLLGACLQRDFGIASPRIAIAGLNPHSGENGQLGTEEQDWLVPWIQQMRDLRPQFQLEGPIPPDTLWVHPSQEWFNQNSTPLFDGILALYHDQGLIPVKMLAFDRAVNTTLGLPFIRTSPDHGTAFGISGKGVANDTSMLCALHLAVELINAKRVNV